MAAAPRLLMIDNVDSFTFMLVDYLRVAGASVRVVRSSAVCIADVLSDEIDGIVISPGPGRAEEAGSSIAVVAACVAARKPLLGVCLGHQALALACGGTVRQVSPVHGKSGPVHHDGSGLFAGIPSPFAATRYHSLGVHSVDTPLIANAWSGDGMIMGLRHLSAPVHGLQFHPESVATEAGAALITAFVDLVRSGA